MIYTPTTALAALKLKVDAVSDPELTDAELTALLADALLFGEWQAGASVEAGAFVGAVLGRLWRSYQSGTSGTVNPFTPFPGPLSYGFVPDGSAYWQDAGPVPPDNYDMRQAAREAWLLKGSKAAKYFKFSPGANTSFNPGEVHAHCLAMAGRFPSLAIG